MRKSEFSADDAMARVAVASMTTMAKAQGQEVTDEDQEQMLKQAKMEMSGSGGADKQDGGKMKEPGCVDGGAKPTAPDDIEF